MLLKVLNDSVDYSIGLIMLIGLIAYISILKAEIGSKLRSRSTLQPALFKVSYGQSFFLFVFGFIATEFVGVLNIFLFINMHEMNYYSVSIAACCSQHPQRKCLAEGQREEQGLGARAQGPRKFPFERATTDRQACGCLLNLSEHLNFFTINL